MHKRTSSGLPRSTSLGLENPEAVMSAVESRYTQESTGSDYARSNEQLAEDQIRKPRLDEGLAFREAI